MPQVTNLKKSRAPRRPRPLSAAVRLQAPAKQPHLTYSDKIRIIDFYRAHEGLPGVTQSSVVQHFHAEYPTLSQSTLSSYLAREKEIREYVKKHPNHLAYKQPVRVALPEIEFALTEWVHDHLRRGSRFTGDLICEQGHAFCEALNIPQDRRIRFSHGWLDRFKERLGLREIWFHGEAASAPIEQIAPEQARLQQILANYAPSEVFNFDETAHFYRQAPKHALGFAPTSGLKDDKTRMSLGLCANADGSEKCPLLFIGNHEKPRAFKGYTAAALGYEYSFNDTAWMRVDVFEKWAQRFDADMRHQNRHVLLLCDIASSHKKFDSKKLTNVCVEFLAPKLTAFIQPLDAGVIRCFKAHYRRAFLRKVLERDAENELHIYRINQLEAMQLSVQAWNQVAPTTIANCWRHTGICPPAFFTPTELPNEEESVMTDLQGDLDSLAQLDGGQFLSAQELVDVDRDVQTEEETTDEMIIQHVRAMFNL